MEFSTAKTPAPSIDISVSGDAFATLTASRGPGEVVWGHFAEPPRRIGEGTPYGKSFHKKRALVEFGASLNQSASVFCKLLKLHLFGLKVVEHKVSNSVLDAGFLRVPSTPLRASFGMNGLSRDIDCSSAFAFDCSSAASFAT